MQSKCKCMHVINHTCTGNMSPEVQDLYLTMCSTRSYSLVDYQDGMWHFDQKDCGCGIVNVWSEPDQEGGYQHNMHFHLFVNHRYLKYLEKGMRKIQY